MRPAPVLIYGKQGVWGLCYAPLDHEIRQGLPAHKSMVPHRPRPTPLASPPSSPSRAYRTPAARRPFDLYASAPLASSPVQAAQMETAKHVIVGTAGHIDHGKSALVEAL